jgi:putative transposase
MRIRSTQSVRSVRIQRSA